MTSASGRLDHDCLADGEVFNRKHPIGRKFDVFGKGTVDLYSDPTEVFTQEIIAALTIEAFATRNGGGRGGALTRLQPGHFGTELNNFTGKLMTRRERKARPEVPLVDVQVGPAKATRVHAQQNFIGAYLRRLNITVAELSRGIVNNGFHKNGCGSAWYLEQLGSIVRYPF